MNEQDDGRMERVLREVFRAAPVRRLPPFFAARLLRAARLPSRRERWARRALVLYWSALALTAAVALTSAVSPRFLEVAQTLLVPIGFGVVLYWRPLATFLLRGVTPLLR